MKNRHLTPEGRMIVMWLIVGVAFITLALLILVPSQYGVTYE